MPDPLPVAIADTSALIAFFNAADNLVASRSGPDPARAALGYISGRVAIGRWEVPPIGPRLTAAHALLGDYPSIGLADAMNVVLAREYRTDVIATLDRRHFRIIRPLTRHGAFRLLPDDVPAGS
jgi:hypothetical protein